MKTEKNIDEQTGMSIDQDMAPKAKKKKPSPDELLAEIRGRGPAKTYEFEDYNEVIHAMQGNNFSYAKIAEFLTERLGYAITRGQVYRAYQSWLEIKAEIERDQAEAEYHASLEPPDFDPEEDEMQQRHRLMAQATGDVIKFLIEKHPEDTLPGTHREVLKRALAFYDEKARDDLEAELADQRLESTKAVKEVDIEKRTE